MATGISKTKWTRGPKPDATASDPRGALERRVAVMLSYEGKRPEAAILATTPAEPHLIIIQPERNGAAPATLPRNRLWYGDNLPILAALARDATVRGHVRLIYIDPPFATKSVFQSRARADAYTDLLAGAPYLEFLRERLILLRELLADDGSIYVHLDENMAFHGKVLMDEIFGASNFRNWITRKKCNPKNYTRKTYGNIADYIIFYTKTDRYIWNRPVTAWGAEPAATDYPKEYRYVESETGRRYMKVPVHAPGVRGGETGQPWRGKNPPPGKHWQYPPATLDAMDARGEIYWSPNGNPRRKVYLDTNAGVPVQDIWLDFRDAHNQNIQITGYPTEKNPDLLRRIVAASTNPGDLVLDCFSGSGTTLAVAEELGRQWIGVDASAEAIATTLRRFMHGTERMGDYVQRPNPAGSVVQLDMNTLMMPAEVAPEMHDHASAGIEREQALPEFTLYAAKPYQGEVDPAVRAWRERYTPDSVAPITAPVPRKRTVMRKRAVRSTS